MSTLYLVATPIGNLEDISARALRLLGQVALVAAEDTRRTRKLLSHYNIHARLLAYHEHNKLAKLPAVLAALRSGDVALVSDAGTPGLNDPGYELVRAVLAAGHQVTPVPGPCAPIAALVVSGLPTDSFVYLGYLDRRAGARRAQLGALATDKRTLVALETPHRLSEALADLRKLLGEREIAVARELTKMHEDIFRGSISQAIARFAAAPPQGEITLVISGAIAERGKRWERSRVLAALEANLARGVSPALAAAQVAGASGWPRREVYKLASREGRPKRPRNRRSGQTQERE